MQLSLLTNTDLVEIISAKVSDHDDEKLVITDFDPNHITPVGYDLRIGDKYFADGEESSLSDGGNFRIASRGIALVRTLEEIRMPKNKKLSGVINSKVSLSCKGLSNISTTVDADWRGNLLVAIHNNSNQDILLKYGDPFCTILFFENKSPAKEGRHSKPDGRTDILADEFKKNTKSAPIAIFVANAIPPIFSVLSLFVAAKSFKDEPYLVSATVAVGVFISTYLAKYVDSAIKYFKRR